MTSPRFSGRAEPMGKIFSVESIPEGIRQGESAVHRLLIATDLGQVALLKNEFRIPPASERYAQVPRATFIEDSQLELGRGESQHQVRFGQMMVNAAGLHERPTLIAAKSFASRFPEENPNNSFAREWTLNTYLNTLSDRQLAYIPLGVWRTARGVAHLLSVYEHDVISYDNTFWVDRDVNPEALRRPNVADAYVECLRGLGYLHGAGIVHTDAEAKNLATDNKGTRFIDLEDASLLPLDGNHIADTDEVELLVRGDIETFLDSCMQVDANRPEIIRVLSSHDFDKRIAQSYRSGFRKGARDAGLRPHFLRTSTNEYFSNAVHHCLTVAADAPSAG